MPRPPVVTRTVKLHAYNVKYMKTDKLDEIIDEGTFYLTKEYKANYLITLNLEKLYGIHVLAINSHSICNVTFRLPLQKFIETADIVSVETILDEYYIDKYIKKKGW